MAKIKAIIPVESNPMALDGGAMFGNAPRALWGKWIEPDKENRIPLATRCLLVQTEDGRNILFEAGIGAFFDPDLKKRYGVKGDVNILLNNLAEHGVEEGDIDAVVLSHLHFDHAGGLLPEYEDSFPALLFPNATFYVGKSHWEYVQSPHMREKASFIPLLIELLDQSDRLELVDGPEHQEMDFGVRFRFSDGHTIGMMISQINLKGGPLLFVSDLVPGVPWVHLPITMGYDRYPELKVDEKKRLFEAVIDNDPKLFFTHDPHVKCARLKKDSGGKYVAEPVSVRGLLNN